MPSISTAPRVDVVEPRDQVGRRGLAAPRRPDERDELARLGLEIDVLERERRQRARSAGRRHRRSPPSIAERRRRPPRRVDAARAPRPSRARAPVGRASRRPSRRPAPRGRGSMARPRSGSGTRRRGSGTWPRIGRGSSGDRVGRIDDLGVHLEVLEDAVEERQRALDLDLHVEQLAEREEEPALERREGDDVADASAPSGRRSWPGAGEPVHERRA